MAWSFGDGFDLYALPADANGLWDGGGSAAFNLVAGRFTGSRAFQTGTLNTTYLIKSSNVNDAVHHFVLAFRLDTNLGAAGQALWFQLLDGGTGQCCVVFARDGALYLTSGAFGGTALAGLPVPAFLTGVWVSFEIEIVIHNTAGSFTVRRNGAATAEYSATGLNTRVSANNYANQLRIGIPNTSLVTQTMDDFFWRSDASSVPWMGDMRCITRMPVSDAAVQFTPSGSTVPVNPWYPMSGALFNTGVSNPAYQAFIPTCNGTLGSATLQCAVAPVGGTTIKCSLFSSIPNTGQAPVAFATTVGQVLASANLVTSPTTGPVVFTFPSPPSVVRGTQYFVGFQASASSGGFSYPQTAPSNYIALAGAGVTYAAFPVGYPVGSNQGNFYQMTVNITPTTAVNAPLVAEPWQDVAASYVTDSTAGHGDLYGIAPIPTPPVSTIAVVTRALVQKTDVGGRTVAVQLKSGATTVTGANPALAANAWTWISRIDYTDPATGLPWTGAAVDALQIGPVIVT